ncbi:hypothetical protein BCV70DRAFT_58632 [Testicularia cyperi]|uniref:Uncharacterized protein n=1 Tax=Testicularia cyperi TaxID=1882483 RepID=A0A317XV80_9BASI|nr:hypothetical protein BCV70DRAFT_58632 [Testicularia cyperi]
MPYRGPRQTLLFSICSCISLQNCQNFKNCQTCKRTGFISPTFAFMFLASVNVLCFIFRLSAFLPYFWVGDPSHFILLCNGFHHSHSAVPDPRSDGGGWKSQNSRI